MLVIKYILNYYLTLNNKLLGKNAESKKVMDQYGNQEREI